MSLGIDKANDTIKINSSASKTCNQRMTTASCSTGSTSSICTSLSTTSSSFTLSRRRKITIALNASLLNLNDKLNTATSLTALNCGFIVHGTADFDVLKPNGGFDKYTDVNDSIMRFATYKRNPRKPVRLIDKYKHFLIDQDEVLPDSFAITAIDRRSNLKKILSNECCASLNNASSCLTLSNSRLSVSQFSGTIEPSSNSSEATPTIAAPRSGARAENAFIK